MAKEPYQLYRKPIAKYLFAVAVAALAALLQLMLRPIISVAVFIVFYPAVFLTAWLAGFGPALLAVVLSSVGAMLVFLPRIYDAHNFYRVSIFVFSALLISWIVSKGNQARDRFARQIQADGERLRTIMETLPIAVLIVDERNRIIADNPAAERLYGGSARLSVADLDRYRRGTSLWSATGALMRADDLPSAQALRTGLAVLDVELDIVRVDGTKATVLDSAAPIRDPDGKISGAVVALRDISYRKKAEEDLRKAHDELEQRVAQRTLALTAANTELEAFSYSVSHDIRAPLRGIAGFSQALAEDYGDKLDGQAREYLNYIQDGVKKLSQLIDDLLSLSRLARSVMAREKIDLSSIARSIVERFRKQEPDRKVDVRVEDHLSVNADPGLFRVVLENLLGNAWKFSSRKENAKIEFGRTLIDGVPTFYVRDNGAGFDMRYAPKLFGAFQRLHTTEEYPGTGVGLATVRRIITRHGGTIWAESKMNEGATFYFRVEADADAKETRHEAA